MKCQVKMICLSLIVVSKFIFVFMTHWYSFFELFIFIMSFKKFVI